MLKNRRVISAALAMSMILSTAITNVNLIYANELEIENSETEVTTSSSLEIEKEIKGKEASEEEAAELFTSSSIDIQAATKDIVTGHDKNGDIILAFPAVNTKGEVISGSALVTDSSDSVSPFDGTPISGPVISGSQIIGGLYYDENNEPKINDTIISEDYANGYAIEYSTDNENFIQLGVYTRVDHSKQIEGLDTRPKFLVHPMVYTISGLESNTKYYFRVKAYTGEYKKINSSEFFNIKSDCYKTFETEATSLEKTPAFPTAQGGGKYALGGRGGDVYTVTNLTDDKDNPQPGSLRYGLKRLDLGKNMETSPRTIVFAVSGTINLKHWLDITDNTTIAGQTAPGDGIVLSSKDKDFGDVKIHGENIIVRYITVRGNENIDRDSVTVSSAKNVIVDHCTFGWGVDETFTVKEVLNSSFQWNIINEALSMPIGASEAEPKHGMAGIWDGNEVAFHHNIIANCGTRNPRLQGGFRYWYNRYENIIDVSNNVIYDWGHNTGYGGERGNGLVNFENNYLKPGPSTLEKCKADRIFDVDKETSSFYVNGNVLTSSEEITNNNKLGLKDATNKQILDKRVELLIPLELDTAETAYERALNEAGAILPRRSAQDARLINDIRNGTGGMINSPSEVGGYPTDEAVSNVKDSDKDGMPDDWEVENGLNPNDASDSSLFRDDGYTNLEYYLNNLAGDYSKIDLTTNPAVSMQVEEQQHFIINEESNIPVTISAENGKKIDKVDLYQNDKIVNSVDLSSEKVSSKTFDIKYTPETEGSFNLIARAYDDEGCSTFSTSIPINVDYPNSFINGWQGAEIGQTSHKGIVSVNDQKLILKGSGNISGNEDSCYFTYVPVEGDCELITRVDAIKRVDTGDGEGKGVKAGIMLRNSLDANSKMVFGAVTLTKVEDIGNDSFGVLRSTSKEIAAYARDKSDIAEYTRKVFGSTPAFTDTSKGNWIKIKKEGKKATVYVSTDKNDWKTLYTTGDIFENKAYIGLAVDAAQGTQEKQMYNRAEFSNIYLNDSPLLDDSSTFKYGDVDLNGTLTAADAALTLQYVLNSDSVNLSDIQLKAAAVSGELPISSNDAAQILQKVLSADYKFAVEEQ